MLFTEKCLICFYREKQHCVKPNMSCKVENHSEQQLSVFHFLCSGRFARPDVCMFNEY